MQNRMFEYVHEQIAYWKSYMKRNPDSEIIPEILDGIRLLKEIIR